LAQSPSRRRKISSEGEIAAAESKPRTKAPWLGRRAVTLDDVAKLAGVSSMTVSRVLNRPEAVSAETVEIVRKAIHTTGYVPNLLAGGLATNRTNLVAVIVPSVTSSLFSACIQSLTDRLDESGYQMLLGLSGYPGAREENLLRAILSRRPDALMLTGTSHSRQSRRQLRGARIPIVEIWDLARKPIDMAVGFSHEEVGRATAEFLLGKGYRRFAIIGADDERARLRWKGYMETMQANGVTEIPTILTPAPTNLSMGRDGLSHLLADGFGGGAVFCSSDSLAHGVLLEAQARQLSVPGDIAVVGFGDIDLAAFTAPALTTVGIDRFAVGRLAAELLLTKLGGGKVAQKVINVGFQIVERASA
jgi:LacI family gluconate utilization system Gnt-I transcriptional repressor